MSSVAETYHSASVLMEKVDDEEYENNGKYQFHAFHEIE